MRLKATTLVMFAVTTLVVTSSGCDTADLQAYCEEVSACQGLNDKDTEACVVIQETREYIDADIGCADEHATYYDCLLAKGTCNGQPIGVGCQDNADCAVGVCTSDMVCEITQFTVENDDCRTEQRAYNNCSFN